MRTSVQSDTASQPSPAESWKMFDRIAPRYDLLNRILSLRRDVAWRKFLYAKLPAGTGLKVLDLATGTGDVLITLLSQGKKVAAGVGLDRSAGMLALGKRKLYRRDLSRSLSLVRGDACAIGVTAESFDAVTMAFGIRNMPNVPDTLRDIHRVLKPGGRVLILEFSLPENRIFRGLYLFYFRHILTRIGALVSGDGAAYRYLNRTVEAFPRGAAFCELLRDTGFENVRDYPLTFGIASLYLGDK